MNNDTEAPRRTSIASIFLVDVMLVGDQVGTHGQNGFFKSEQRYPVRKLIDFVYSFRAGFPDAKSLHAVPVPWTT